MVTLLKLDTPNYIETFSDYAKAQKNTKATSVFKDSKVAIFTTNML